jgi:hypothetical protein
VIVASFVDDILNGRDAQVGVDHCFGVEIQRISANVFNFSNATCDLSVYGLLYCAVPHTTCRMAG